MARSSRVRLVSQQDWLPSSVESSSDLGTVSVKDHGAVGDGVADDTAAITAAIAALTPGQRLVIPAGTYKHTGLSVTGKTDFVVDGAGATLNCTTETARVLRIVNCSRFTVRGLRIKHATQSARNSSGYGLDIVNSTDGLVEGCHIGQVCAAGIYHDAASARITIQGNTVSASLADGIHVKGACADITIQGNRIDAPGDDGIAVVSYLVDPARNKRVSIIGNIVRGYTNLGGRGISVVGGEQVTITGNVIDGVAYAGIHVNRDSTYNTYGVRDVIVDGNTITGSSARFDLNASYGAINVTGGEVGNTIESVVITNNVIRDSLMRDIVIEGNAGALIGRVLLKGNLIQQTVSATPDSTSVECGNVEFLFVEDNKVFYAHRNGIYVKNTVSVCHTFGNYVYKPNQADAAGIYGIFNAATTASAITDRVVSDGTKTALTAARSLTNPATSSTQEGANASQGYTSANVLSGVDVTVTKAAYNALQMAATGGGIKFSSTGVLSMSSGANPATSDSDVAITRDQPRVFKVLGGPIGGNGVPTGNGFLKALGGVSTLNVNTTGLSSAQIDTAVFPAGVTAFDDLVIHDATNHLLLVRQGGAWYKTAALTAV